VPVSSALPGATLVQVPCRPATPQLWQEGHRATPQQKPSVQWPAAHWSLVVQAAPAAWGGTQVPLTPVQKLPGAQSRLPLQWVGHPGVPVVVHWYGAQLTVATIVGQAPAVQTGAGEKVGPEQAAVPQVVPAATWVQAPAPLQVPVFPQVALAHWPAGAAVLAAIAVQVPSVPARLQALQVPQAVVDEQQTPSMQPPLPHSWAAAQVAPSAFLGVQVPAVAAVQ
jgi:hypothetical protein